MGRGRELRVEQEKQGEDSSERALENELEAAANAVRVFLGDLQPIIVEADGSKEERAEENQPDERVLGFRPEQCGNHNRTDQKNSAHGGRSLFRAVEFEQFMDLSGRADRLAKLQ